LNGKSLNIKKEKYNISNLLKKKNDYIPKNPESYIKYEDLLKNRNIIKERDEKIDDFMRYNDNNKMRFKIERTNINDNCEFEFDALDNTTTKND